jgi:hypothetical protein
MAKNKRREIKMQLHWLCNLADLITNLWIERQGPHFIQQQKITRKEKKKHFEICM